MRLHRIPFPQVRSRVKDLLDDQPVKECYVFKDEGDDQVPTIVFFPLVNSEFRTHKVWIPDLILCRESEDTKCGKRIARKGV